MKEGIILCSESGPGCLKGENYKQAIEEASRMGYNISVPRRSLEQLYIIDNRIILEDLPEELPLDQVVVVKGPPRIGKTHWSIRQLIDTMG